MALIQYNPTRQLVQGSVGEITTDLIELERVQKSVGKTSTALAGTRETILHRIDYTWKATTKPFDPSALGYWREFAASCAGSEYLIADFSDIAGGPAFPFNARLVADSYEEKRYSHFWFQVSFQLIEG